MTTTTDRVVTASFDVGAGSSLTISTVSGKIVVRGSDEPGIEMRAEKHGKSEAMENTQIEWTQDGNDVRIETKSGRQDGFLGNLTGKSICAVDFEIRVPRDCRVRASGISADVELRNLDAEASARTVSGDIYLQGVRGDCSVDSVSGDLNARRVEGALTLRTTSGDTTVRDASVTRLDLHTVSGDCTLQTPLSPGGFYRAHTVSGDLHLRVPPGTGASAQLKTVSGRVRVTGLQASVAKHSPRVWQGVVNGGGATIEMSSVSGDLDVRAEGPDTGAAGEVTVHQSHWSPEGNTVPSVPDPPSPPDQPTPSGESDGDTIAILKRLESGEITIEDAMRMLDERSR